MEEPIRIVEIDYTLLDVMIKDDRDLPVPGRDVQITTIQDHNTGCVIRFSLSFSSQTTGHGDIKLEDN